jgi:hypothetical protein
VTYSSYSPEASEKYAIDLPSGLQAGVRSAAPLVRVRLRGEPFLAGAVQTSPRASTTARLPVGEMAHEVMYFAASTGLRTQARARAGDRDDDGARFRGREVEQDELRAVLEDDLAGALRPGADRGPLHVLVAVGRHLAALPARGVVDPDVLPVRRAFVGEVVELVALPHRLRVRTFPVRDLARGVALQVEQPDVRLHAAAVALPRARVDRVRRVREPLAARADRAERAVGNGELLGQAALRRDGEELDLAVAPGEAVREEQELPVGRPVREHLAEGWCVTRVGTPPSTGIV